MTWVQFPATIIFVYSKLSPIKDSVFQFLIKHLHICYKFSYGMSNHEIYSVMLYQNIVLQNKLCKLSPILLMLSCLFGHSKKSLILGCICKVVNSIYKKYVIFISQISLSPFRPISEIDWQQVIFVFLLQLSVNAALRRK